MEFETLIVKIADGIATVTINRPEAMNALNQMVLRDLTEAFCLLADNSDVRVVILTGEGRAFVAGADIETMSKLDFSQAKAFSANGQAVFNEIENLPKPVIAAVNGFALGGGCELAMACHIRIASSKAQFGQPEVTLGLIPGFGGTQRLPRLVGKGIALELLLTGEIIDARRAAAIGLVNWIVEPQNLMKEATALAEKIIAQAPLAQSAIIEIANKGSDETYELSQKDGLKTEAKKFGEILITTDGREGMTAFIEKRKPTWTGQ